MRDLGTAVGLSPSSKRPAAASATGTILKKIHAHDRLSSNHLAFAEMRAFLDWFNKPGTSDPVLRAAIAHLWFVTIHPFDDGNGRIARAVADMALARADQTSQRFYRMSAQIQLERNAYYDILERTQNADLDITAWLTFNRGILKRDPRWPEHKLLVGRPTTIVVVIIVVGRENQYGRGNSGRAWRFRADPSLRSG